MKVGIVGSYDVSHKAVCGQSDKTELFEKKIKEQLGDKNVRFVNTFAWKSSMIRSLLDIVFLFFSCRNIVIMTSINGTKLLYLLSNFFKLFTHKKVFHIVVGGKKNIELIENHPRFLKIAKKMDGIYVEIQQMVEEYKRLGINRVRYVPNCKDINSKTLPCDNRSGAPIKFCVYSKINREKGVPDAINAIVAVNEKFGKKVCDLDIYGVVEDTYKDEFQHTVQTHSDCLHFFGKISRDTSFDILSRYYAMLFPTHHPEGVPGTMIDAYEAGLPIIAYDSFYISEIIKDGYTGLLVEENSFEKLCQVIEDSVKHPVIMDNLRKNCYKEAEKYDSTSVISSMLADMDLR